MARNFIAVTQDEIDVRIAESIKAREMELATYDYEKAGHEQAIASMAGLEWTEETAKYRGLQRDDMIRRALSDGLTSEQIEEVANLNALENHRLALEAVKLETKRSEKHYETAVAALPSGTRRTKALAKLAEKEAAAEAKK